MNEIRDAILIDNDTYQTHKEDLCTFIGKQKKAKNLSLAHFILVGNEGEINFCHITSTRNTKHILEEGLHPSLTGDFGEFIYVFDPLDTDSIKYIYTHLCNGDFEDKVSIISGKFNGRYAKCVYVTPPTTNGEGNMILMEGEQKDLRKIHISKKMLICILRSVLDEKRTNKFLRRIFEFILVR